MSAPPQPESPAPRWTTARGVGLGAAVGVFLVAAVVASSGTVHGWEASVFHAVNDLPDALEIPMWVFQLAGLVLLPVLVAIGAAFFRRWHLAATLVALVPLKLFVELLVVKQLVERERPGTTICALQPDCGKFRNVPMDGLSFVSGHAIVAWGIATLLWPYLGRRLRWIPVTIAGLNALARVYLGAHNPLDVIGGGAIGVALGLLLCMAVGAPRPARR